MIAKLYFESHVTIDPIHEHQKSFVEGLCEQQGFKLAKLFMRKDFKDHEHQDDAFMTGHGKDLLDIKQRTVDLVRTLQCSGFVVRRYKIEDTVLDSRHDDELGLL